jgi:hypothetical protein
VRGGYNPTRRNRNIGTAKQGQGKNNKLKIPAICNYERIWWEQLARHKKVQRYIAGRNLLFIVEATRTDYFHCCTIDDICQLLALVPSTDWEGLETFVLRQPTHKQAVLKPAWGRLAYSANFGRPGQKSISAGPALIIEAQNPNKVISWSVSLDPDDQAEIERLKADGHQVIKKGSRLLLHSSLDVIRKTQLYRTVLHEIGHWVDWLEKIVRPSEKDSANTEKIEDAYFARPQQERETFAHRYATQMRERLITSGEMPFERIISQESALQNGLRIQDFFSEEKS